jgi:hypothetical protein
VSKMILSATDRFSYAAFYDLFGAHEFWSIWSNQLGICESIAHPLRFSEACFQFIVKVRVHSQVDSRECCPHFPLAVVASPQRVGLLRQFHSVDKRNKTI